jgi:hypothetical protein
VITVTVRDENEIGRYFLDVDLPGERIRPDERIEEKCFTGNFDGKTGMSVIGKFHFEK